MEIIEGILNTAAAAGYNVMLCPTVSSNLQEFEDIALKQDQLDPVAGLITLCRLRPNSLVLLTLPDDIPIVQCCEYDESLPYPIVAIDNYAAAFHATTYLLGLGYTKLAIFNSSCHTLYGKKREQGFRDALAAKGITPREDWMLHLGAIDYNLALAATRNLFSQSDHPEAIFTVSDVYAAGITKALAQMGIRVPEDVSVVGFDDTEIALINTPSLTTVQQPRHKLGMTACNVLLRLIRTGSCTSPYFMVESDLIVRDSTCAKLTL
jgi:DNA-binding LacI/PurR family transcriptional regulator